MATSSFFHDVNIDTPEKAESFIEALEKTEAIALDTKRKRYENNLISHGCGYWSVCDEAGYACPCASDSKVMQGYDEQAWDSLKKSLEKAAADMENEFFDFSIDEEDYEDDFFDMGNDE